MKSFFLLILSVIFFPGCYAQTLPVAQTYAHADTLRGSITTERIWWDVLQYDIVIKPDYSAETTAGKNRITYKVTSGNYPPVMQVDLQSPLHIDSIIYNDGKKLQFKQEGKAWHVTVPPQIKSSINHIDIHFSGKPHQAHNPPWDGGWTFTTDSLGRPWMAITCQGIGASVWYPCKDHQSDEPDEGASITMIVPDSLVGVSNGRLQYARKNGDGTATYKWLVVNPISNYSISLNIGQYVNFTEPYKGAKGSLLLNYWVMDYNIKRARNYMPGQVHNMLKSLEYWFGPYPFYEDGYKLIEAPYLGMEHQSAVAYGNGYRFGYKQFDRSETGWGLKFDYIIVHESGHEWFGNNITTKDIADLWVHESFTTYSESLFVESMFGKKASDEYTVGIRRSIKNNTPIIAPYGVNREGSGDMYNKGANMLHTIRNSMNNDSVFTHILRGLNQTFYHRTVTSSEVEKFFSSGAGYDYSKVFDQYLRTVQIPKLEYYFSANRRKIFYRWNNCVRGFNLPVILKATRSIIKLMPTANWKTVAISNVESKAVNVDTLKKLYYIDAEEVVLSH